ncbi:hypothetical protein HPB50_006767 [Hyalomma asiaticum]|uniref:Uncharacterized protein n=1 Tax=Hyalomma asiaticum TaxID=266040 RepID=A0ACB7SLP7_HYAAI|nr:hypothetical protein HPB50_006767 [Hyalomma asiaticum]
MEAPYMDWCRIDFQSLEPLVFVTTVINDLIEILTSRFPAEALRPNSPAVQKLNPFLEFLNGWGNCTKGQQGFLSKSTPTGLRVTIGSMLALLKYLCEDLRYNYLMTSRNVLATLRLSEPYLKGILKKPLARRAFSTWLDPPASWISEAMPGGRGGKEMQ